MDIERLLTINEFGSVISEMQLDLANYKAKNGMNEVFNRAAIRVDSLIAIQKKYSDLYTSQRYYNAQWNKSEHEKMKLTEEIERLKNENEKLTRTIHGLSE